MKCFLKLFLAEYKFVVRFVEEDTIICIISNSIEKNIKESIEGRAVDTLVSEFDFEVVCGG
jgi:hypothetical protein